MTKLSIVIPAYNEELNIGEVISKVFRHSNQVLVINDGSTDNTEKIALESKAIVKSHILNRGLGATVRDGINEAMKLGADIFATDRPAAVAKELY